jgi:hypothetical protein
VTLPSFLSKPAPAGLLWGLIGGVTLIIVTLLSAQGLIQIVPYPFILIGAILTIKYTNNANKIFTNSFIAGLLAFIIMSLILYVYIITYANPHAGIPLRGHLWRIGLIVGLGMISSFMISFVAKPVK